MSYAAVAKKNAPPESEQPQPDQSLLEGHSFEGETETHLPDVDHKISVVEHDWPSHPETSTTLGEINPELVHTVGPGRVSPNIGSVLRPAEVPEPSVSEVAPTPAIPPPRKERPTTEDLEAEAEQKFEEAERKKEKKEAKEEAAAAAEKTKKTERKVAEAKNDLKKDVKKAAKAGEEKVEQTFEDAKKEGKNLGKKTEKFAKEVKNEAKEFAHDAENKARELKKKAGAELEKAEHSAAVYWEKTKDIVLRPGTLGGLMGVANVGLLSTLGYFAYTRRDQAWNRSYVGGAVAGVLGLFAAEGVVAERYSTTPEGKAELERAKAEGSRAYLQAKEIILRPGVAGGLLGALNVAVLGAVGYFGYRERNRQVWDRKIVSGIVCGLISLSAAEGLATNVYRQKELPRQKKKGNA